MKALLSVSDKSGIVDFAKSLCQLGYEILSTGGTMKVLQQSHINAIEVSDFTGASELFNGRVKTLHPKIHGGILFRRDIDKEEAEHNAIESIDIVCVNLYPFEQSIMTTDDFAVILENIDIGGPALIRAAAKNFQSVLVLTNPQDYSTAIDKMSNNANSLEFRRLMMIKAFEHTASYDSMIANYMNRRFSHAFGNQYFIAAHRVCETSYGENPHQKGALYEHGDFWNKLVMLKGSPSFNNIMDLNQAIKIVTSFGNKASAVIVKHGNPCGFALRDSLSEAYKAALACDPVSAYGGVLALNGTLDKTLADVVNEHYLEVIIAAQITQEACEVFAHKKRIKLFATNTPFLYLPCDGVDFKRVEGGFLLQESDCVKDYEIKNAALKTKRQASSRELKDMEIAYRLAAFTKSNCVVYVKNGAMVAIGMGMTSRVDAARAALHKAQDVKSDVKGAVLASEAFFPFRDSIDSAAQSGISAIIQPGGSIRDKDVIEAANEHNIAMYFTGTRHFYH